MKLLGPGLLVVVALALPLWADTGGAARATLYIAGPSGGGPAGGAGGLPGGCLSPLIPIPPPLAIYQTTHLFHDADGDGLLDSGDMVSYTAEIRSFSPEPLAGLHLLVLFPRELVPVALSGEWERVALGDISAMTVPLPTLLPEGRIKVGFAAVFRETGRDEMPEVFVEGLVYGDGFVVAADDPTTSAFLDPAVVAVRQVAGGAGALFPDPSVFAKRASTASDHLRLGKEGDTVEFDVSYTALVGEGKVKILDFVPAPLRLIRGSLPSGVKAVDLGGLTILRAEFGDVSPGEHLSLRYKAVVGGPVRTPYIATHALAISRGGIAFSDDPLTASRGDPTAVLFPWADGEGGRSWKALGAEGFPVPVILRLGDGNEALRWAVFGPPGAIPTAPRFMVVQVPVRYIPQGSVLGFLASQLSDIKAGDIYVPTAYGMPVFAALAGGAGFLGKLSGPFCEDLLLPVVVELPEGIQPHLAGVIVDEGI